ncbi:MAG: hypothetical protein QOH93_3399, partial [Chloroflexia bacterium]|nr:hypothetical protein [Chloroflexia bacterium]
MNKRAILGAAALTMLVVVGVVVWLANRQEGFDRSKAVPGTATPLASVVAVASPTPQVAPASTPEGGTTITFAVWEEDRSVYGPLKDAFEAEHPGLHVRLLSLEDVVQKRTLTNNGQTIAVQDPLYSIPEIASAADAAAVALPAEAMSKGYMRDLKPLMDADPQFDRTDFYTGTLESLTRGRSTYLLPSYVNVPLLNYNKDLWTAAQVGGPNTGWKWADLLGAADKLALTNGNKIERYGTMGWGNGVDSLLAELHVAGVDLDPAGETRLDTPEVAAAFNRVVAWAQSGMVYVLLPTAADAGGATPGSDETSTLIMGGKVGLWSPNLLDETQADLPFATGVLPSPSAPSFAEGYVMSSGTQHPQETWQWLSFLSKQEIPWTHGGPFPVERVPARKSVALSSGYWTKLDAGTRAAVEAILEGAATQPLTLVNSRVFDSDTLAFALREVASGKTTAEQALRDVQAEIDSHALPPVSASNPVVVAGPATTATLTLTLSPQSTAATGTSTATAGTQVPLSTPVIDPSLSLDQFYEKAFMDLALRSPELYTELGLPASYKPDFRHDSLTDVSDAYTRETYEWAKTYLAGLRKYDRAKQTAQQLISTGILDWYLDDMVRGEEFMYDDYIVNPLFGVQNNVQDLMTNLHPLTNKEQAEDYV